MDAKKLRDERRRAELSLTAVAGALNRTKSWLSKIENGTITVDNKTFHKINQTIERLRTLREKQWDFSDLRLPDAKNRHSVR